MEFQLLAGALLLLFAVYSAIFFVVTLQRLAAHPGGDFFALWSAARVAATHAPALVYDAPRLHDAQMALGLDPHADYPFPYPPFFLLALWPLQWMPYVTAYCIAIGGTLGLYVWATVGNGWRWSIAAGALLAPVTTITLAAGQAGFLAAALLVGGFRLLDKRPAAAGVLFGLATYKPQLGLLVPVALLAAGRWRSIAAAAATVAVLVLATTVAFGPAIWPAWVAGGIRYNDEFASAHAMVAHLMPTVFAALVHLGVSVTIAYAAQVVAAAAMACTIWFCFRRGEAGLSAAALFVATFLATPHAFVYDMPPVTTAGLWLFAECRRTNAALATSEIAVVAFAMIVPIALVAGGAGSAIVALSLLLLLTVIVRRCLQYAPQQ